MATADPQTILDFWFADVTDDDFMKAMPRWFRKDPAQDAAIRERFGASVDAAIAGELDHWADTPRDALALLILLDQWPRNLFRGSARAFEGDAKARAVAGALVDAGHDQTLSPIERAFVYLPFMHGEAPEQQARALACYQRLSADGGPRFAPFLDYAHKHADVIEAFGRYPHRNAALGRETTPAEQVWLDAGGGF